MPRILRHPDAEADLAEIWLFVGRNNPDAADRTINQIDERCQLLADNPMMGRRRPEFGPDVRSFPSDNHVIFYVPVESGVEILRVVHGTRSILGPL